MDDKKIIIDINKKDGSIKAETFGVKGVSCIDALDKLLVGIALTKETDEKEDLYQEELITEEMVTDYV